MKLSKSKMVWLGALGVAVAALLVDRLALSGDEAAPNEQGLKFYEALFDECLKHGIEPVVTISHYEMPYHLVEKYDSWRDRRLIGFYENFCRAVFTRYKGKVKYWITFNEINAIALHPFVAAGIRFAEGENKEKTVYQAAHHQFLAAAKAVKLGHSIDPDFRIGCERPAVRVTWGRGPADAGPHLISPPIPSPWRD